MQSKADLHLHTIHSDGVGTVCDVLEHVSRNSDLKMICITDHDCIDGAKLAARLAPNYGIEAIVGEEVSTLHGHLLALFIERQVPSHRALPETIQAIHAQGGLAIAPHPFDHSVPSIGASTLGAVLGDLGLDGIEGFNAGVYWPMRACNVEAQQHAQMWRLPIVGGSDSHSLATIGKGFTTFEGATAQDLFAAIKSNQVNWGGCYWSVNDYLDHWRRTVHNQGLAATLHWARSNLGQPGELVQP